jgi:hypothetical protein
MGPVVVMKGLEACLLSLSRIATHFLSHPARNLVTILTKLSLTEAYRKLRNIFYRNITLLLKYVEIKKKFLLLNF